MILRRIMESFESALGSLSSVRPTLAKFCHHRADLPSLSEGLIDINKNMDALKIPFIIHHGTGDR